MSQSNRLEDMVREHSDAMLRAAAAILGDPREAEDAVQDTFVKYLEKQPGFPDARSERAWLMRVTANACKSRLRAARRHPQEELLDVYPAPSEDHRDVAEAVLELPANQRAAVHLFYYEGFSTQEIARIMNCRPGTVRSYLSRARDELRRKLKGDVDL